MKKILSGLLIASSLSACLFDNKDDVKSSSSQSSSSVSSSDLSSSSTSSSSIIANQITVSDNCGAMIFAQGNNYKDKIGKLYASSIASSACKWEVSSYPDSKIFASGDYAYLLEGLGSDKLTQYEAKTGTLKFQIQFSTASNPNTIGFVDQNTALIGLYDAANLYKIDLKQGKIIDSLDLTALTPTGVKSPTPGDILIKDGNAYLALQRMDAKWKSANAVVIKINPTTLKIEDSIQLKTTNPFQLTIKGSKILAVSKGNTDYDANMKETSRKDGGIEELDFSTHTSTIIANETELGGKPISVEIRDDGKAYISLYKTFGNNPVGLWDFTAKSFTALNGSTNAWGGMVFNPATQEVFLAEDNGTTTSILSFKDMTAGTSYFQDMVQPYSLTIRP